MLDQFRSFLLHESKHYLGQRSGDLLNALQNLQDDADGLGNRALLRSCRGIVNQIRRILHGRWEEEDKKYLKELQKIGVAIMKAVDENGDLQEVISSSVTELETLLDKLQVPINSLATEEGDTTEPETPAEEEPLKKGSELGA